MKNIDPILVNLCKERRDKLLASWRGSSAIWVFASGQEKQKNADVHYAFRPESTFYYLTGLQESNAYLVLDGSSSEAQWILFHQGYDALKAKWEGASLSHEMAKSQLAIDDCRSVNDFADWMIKRATDKIPVHALGKEALDDKLYTALTQATRVYTESLKPTVHAMRMIKDAWEQTQLQKAADLGVSAFKQAMRISVQEKISNEYEIYALFCYHCYKHGALDFPFPPIVASGSNATVLHYTNNNHRVSVDDCVLMDAGAQRHYYASDITRVWPISGRFSAPQKDVYQHVLACQKQLIQSLKPGIQYTDVQKQCVLLLTQSLIDLGVLQASLDQCLEEKQYLPYFMHSFGHSLGLDVHDDRLASDRTTEVFAENMVYTVEPGLYFPKDDTSVPQHLRGIGVRIEDDCLICKDGARVLTAALVKEVDDIEQWVQG